MAERNAQKLGDTLRVTSGLKTQLGRSPEELLDVVNAIEWAIREFDKAQIGGDSLVVPRPEIGNFLGAAYAITRFMAGIEPTHPMLANILRTYGGVMEEAAIEEYLIRVSHGEEPLRL